MVRTVAGSKFFNYQNLNMVDMERFSFHGSVLPEREGLSIPFTNFTRVDALTGYTFKTDLFVSSGLITAIVEPLSIGVLEPFRFKTIVEDSIRSIIDIHGYYQGKAYDVEIKTCIEPDGKVREYGIGVTELEGDISSRPVPPAEIIRAFGQSDSLPIALGDLRESVKSGHTALFCYRALESMRQHFYKIEDGNDRCPSWERMRNNLNLTKDWINRRIGKYAVPQRHGSNQPMSNAEIILAIQSAWQVMDRFCYFLTHNGKPLDQKQWPAL